MVNIECQLLYTERRHSRKEDKRLSVAAAAAATTFLQKQYVKMPEKHWNSMSCCACSNQISLRYEIRKWKAVWAFDSMLRRVKWTVRYCAFLRIWNMPAVFQQSRFVSTKKKEKQPQISPQMSDAPVMEEYISIMTLFLRNCQFRFVRKKNELFERIWQIAMFCTKMHFRLLIKIISTSKRNNYDSKADEKFYFKM